MYLQSPACSVNLLLWWILPSYADIREYEAYDAALSARASYSRHRFCELAPGAIENEIILGCGKSGVDSPHQD